MKNSNAFISAYSDFTLRKNKKEIYSTINQTSEFPDNDDEPVILVPPKK